MKRDEYAERLVPLALRLVAVVRQEGPEAIRAITTAVRELPAPDGVDPMEALAVVLAAAVDPKPDDTELLGWVEQLPEASELYRGITAEHVRDCMVELAIDGLVPAASLTDDELEHVVLALMDQGIGAVKIALHLDCEQERIEVIVHREYNRRSRARRKQAA